MDEAELRPMFEEIGEIYDLFIIRDKTTAAHRGEVLAVFCSNCMANKAPHDCSRLRICDILHKSSSLFSHREVPRQEIAPPSESQSQ
jgi:hypothetical protein